MNRAEAKKKISGLRDLIRSHDRRYFIENRPGITDHEYDRLYTALKNIEKKFPELVTPDSPTQRISEKPLEGV
jgi:DNA ligase (NAD+)